MYTISHTVFGKYREHSWTATFDEALVVAENIRIYGGWINIRITHPDGMVTQFSGE